MLETKNHEQTSEKELNKREFKNLSDEEFRLTIIKMLSRLERRLEKLSENLHKKTENIKQKLR